MARAKDINAYFAKVLKQTSTFSKKDMERVGDAAKDIIVDRTKQGLDSKRTIFKAYAPSYKAERAKAGLKTFPVDLTRTEEMLDSLYVDAKANKVTIGDTDPVAEYINSGTKNMPARNFLGMDNQRDVKTLEEKIQVIGEEKIRKLK